MLITLGVVVWLVIFIGGKYEWEHNVPIGCDEACAVCSSSSFTGVDPGCYECKPGYINGGLKCFDDLAALPPVSTAAGLGGQAYFTLIILAQVLGASCQVMLMVRLIGRRLLSRREAAILIIALGIEIVRMLAVDLYMLRDCKPSIMMMRLSRTLSLPSGPLALWPSDPLALWPSGPLALWPSRPLALSPSRPLALSPSPVSLRLSVH